MNTLYVVASSSKQRAQRLPAAQLYTGELFSAAIAHARRFAKEEAGVRVMSPQYGLMMQDRLIEPHRLTFAGLDAGLRARLIETIRAELPRRGLLPLRIVTLAPDEVVELLRGACAGTRFESVPIRAPLRGRGADQQLQWLQAATWPLECDVALPASERLSPRENERLQEVMRVAARWWSRSLMRNAPPPEATLFADALAQELCQSWEEVAAATRGEWPEDVRIDLTFPNASRPIIAALKCLGLVPRDWWKREGVARLPPLSMSLSLASVSVQNGAKEEMLFP